jgi:hypothetical protein
LIGQTIRVAVNVRRQQMRAPGPWKRLLVEGLSEASKGLEVRK